MHAYINSKEQITIFQELLYYAVMLISCKSIDEAFSFTQLYTVKGMHAILDFIINSHHQILLIHIIHCLIIRKEETHLFKFVKHILLIFVVICNLYDQYTAPLVKMTERRI